jgi:superoxide dismutase, Fe-Mn family
MSHTLPPLPYDYAALEPHIDAQTMQLHHDKHHASYVTKLNEALENYPDLQQQTVEWLLLNLRKVPEKVRSAVQHNAGGHLNHTMFWRSMTPGASNAPRGALAEAINRDFGGLEQFKAKFAAAGSKHFASGWVWLVREQNNGGALQIYTTAGHDNPVMQGHCPVLLNDVWEHAYYLKYQNRRDEYLSQWWAVVNWDEAATLFERAERSAHHGAVQAAGATRASA